MTKKYLIVSLLLTFNGTLLTMNNTTAKLLFSPLDYQTFCAIQKINTIVWELIEQAQETDPYLSVERPTEISPCNIFMMNYATKQGLFFIHWCNTPEALLTPWGRITFIGTSLGSFKTWTNIKNKLNQRITQSEWCFNNEAMKKIGQAYKICAVDGYDLPDAQEEPDVRSLLHNQEMIKTIWNAMAAKYAMENQIKSVNVNLLN